PWIVPDGLWQRIEPLLPKPQRNPRYPGRKPLPDRQVQQRREYTPLPPAAEGERAPGRRRFKAPKDSVLHAPDHRSTDQGRPPPRPSADRRRSPADQYGGS